MAWARIFKPFTRPDSDWLCTAMSINNWATRASEAEVPSLEEARQFRAVAGEVYRSILTRLPQEAHPQSLSDNMPIN
jgi:hypothetical protein